MSSTTKKIFLSATALGAIAVGVVPGTAQAATTESSAFKICNHGSDYTVQATFPDRGGLSSFVLSHYQCWDFPVNPGEAFYLQVQRADNTASFITKPDHTNNAPTTEVTTKYTFDSFAYTKF